MRTNRYWLILAWGWACCALAHAVTPMVSLGQDHGLALRSDGTVVSWGSDIHGQLGIGRSLISTIPLKVPGLSSVRSIAGGSAHSLAVRKDGTVWAWGANAHGQLGDGTAIDRSSPVQVPGVTNAVMACGGYWHTAALRQDGTVWTWGTNSYGQLANGTPDGAFWSTPPGPVTGMTGVTSIACYSNQTIALLQDGTVRAWGANGHGELGDGTTTDRGLPVQVSGLSNVVAINGTAALKSDGTVWEWGYCGWSGLPPNLVPVQAAGISGAVAIGVSNGSIFGAQAEAIKSDGVTWWEWTPGTTPSAQAPAGQLKAVASAPWQTFLLKADGSVVASGLNGLGHLGIGITPTGGWDWYSDFLPVVGLSNVTALASGDTHALALDASGDVWAWGDDALGQLGRGGALSNTVPTVIPGLNNIVQVAASQAGASLAVDQSGNVWAWGNNYHGQLGDGTGANRSAPVRLTGIQDVQTVSGGDVTSMALKRDGSVWAWGNNFYGQLGNGSAPSGSFSTAPAPVAGLTNFTAIAAHDHMLAVRQDGTVWAWGFNGNGQLGVGTTASSLLPVQIPALSGVKSVAAGGGVYSHSFAIKTDGTVMAWGAGQLGNGPWLEKGQLTPVPVPGLTGVVEISSSDRHTLARRTDGSVWGWGQAWGSALGSRFANSYNAYSSTDIPLAIVDLGPMQAMSTGNNFSALLGTDGLLYMGGANAMGQLGDGTFAQHPDFVLAVAPGGTGFLNLGSTGTRIPAALQTPFFVSSTGGITSTSASVATTTQFNPSDKGKSGAVYITASVPSGSSLAQSAKSASASSGPHPNKAAAATPDAFTLLQLTPTGWQTVTNGQLLPYASGVLGDQLAAQTILNGTDTTSLKGAEFCIGYGTTATDMLANGNIRAVATIPGATSTASCVVGGNISVGINVVPGWNLLGNPVNQGIAVAKQFADASKVNSVWKWDSTAAKWQFYAPGMSTSELQSYATDQGYTVLSEIQAGDGFWVNAKTQADLGTLTGAAINLRQSSLSTGWNLVATANAITPQDFNISLSTTPPTVGQVPVNVTSLWAWDSAQSQWYFYAPSLDATALAQYIQGQGYRDFGTASKTVGNGAGFWVRRP